MNIIGDIGQTPPPKKQEASISFDTKHMTLHIKIECGVSWWMAFLHKKRLLPTIPNVPGLSRQEEVGDFLPGRWLVRFTFRSAFGWLQSTGEWRR